MTQTAAFISTTKEKNPSLASMYSIINSDLRLVDDLILNLVKNEIPLITDIVTHIVASGGKRIRPALTLICAELCGYKGDRQISLAAAVEFIHTATLLHDDVVDESKLRRGLPTSNEVFGNKASVLVGDFLLSQAFQLMVGDGSLKVLKILSGASAVIAKGEVMQLMAEGEPQTGIDNYLNVIEAKTAILFAAACEIGAVISENIEREAVLHDFGMNIGIAFQLIDDALDYVANEQALGKNIGDDFREGKITLPVILSYSEGSGEERAFWERTLGDLNQMEGDLDTAIDLIKKYDTIKRTVDMAESYCENARQALLSFPESQSRSALFDLVDFCTSRAY